MTENTVLRGHSIRITPLRNVIIHGYPYKYSIRHSDDSFDIPATIEKKVTVNHYADIHSKTELVMEKSGYITLTEDERETIHSLIGF